jgi:hypothetical protein
MNPYSYIASIRIRHPEMSHETITDTLGIKPNTAFPPRPDYHTFWAHHYLMQDDGDLPKFVANMIQDLKQHRAFFRGIIDGGGSVGLIVDVIEHGAELHLQLPHDLLSSLGDLGVSMDFTVYDHKVQETPSA